MKKIILLIFTVICATSVTGQTYSAQNINLIGHIDPDSLAPQNNNQYSGCWGWHQPSKNKEYAISGARNGTWFIDVTNPATPSVCAYVPGVSKNCTWREVKTYQNYCYIASDACWPNAFQIVDMQYLPDSVVVVHSDTTKFILGHTLWVDQDKLYVGSTTFDSNNDFSAMSVWSLANPADPQLYRRLEQDDQNVNEVHDMYVRNDTVYASVGWQGLRIYKLNHNDSSLTQIGSYSNYSSSASYNHSSFLTQDGKYLLFCDEVPASRPIRIVDVQNLQNIQPVKSWNPYPQTTPHNPYLLGNTHAVVASYQDGLLVYDISNPFQPVLTGFFDTYYQAGKNTGMYGTNTYAGNWGAYPYLPSGVVIATDMRNGIYLLDASTALNPTVTSDEQVRGNRRLQIYPNPATSSIMVLGTGERASFTLYNMLGEIVLQGSATANRLDVSGISAGVYLLEANDARETFTTRLIISGQ